MLNRLLELLRAGGTRRVTDLARELDTTPQLVEMMLDDLGRVGYLRRVEGACGEACGSCSMTASCAVAGGTHLWVLSGQEGKG